MVHALQAPPPAADTPCMMATVIVLDTTQPI